MEIPDGYFGAVFARSGLASKQGLRPANCVGVCDSDYRGEYIVALHNDSQIKQIINPGDRIAQLVVMPYLAVTFTECDELSETKKGGRRFWFNREKLINNIIRRVFTMENRIVKFKSKESGTLNLHAIPGHFATTHSHINYYVDVTSIKTRASEAKEAAKILQTKMPRGAYIDTIVCMDGTQMIGAFLSEEIEKSRHCVNKYA